MRLTPWLNVVCVLLTVATHHAGEPRSSQKPPDPCALVTRAEIETVQGEKVTDTKSSWPESRDFAVSQCFYTVADFAKSVSLEVTRKDPQKPDAPGPREHWMKLFHQAEGKREQERESNAQEGGKAVGKPQPVAGVGDEAFWMGDRIVGALYVLKGDAYFRISVGGPDAYAVKLDKSTRLATKAMKRL